MTNNASPIDPASSPRWAIAGRVVTMDAQSTVVPDGAVWVKDAAIAAVTKRGDAGPEGFDSVVPLETRGTIFPGLIELHNHVAYNALPLWQVPQRYTNRDTWGNSDEYHRLITAPMRTIGEATELLPALVRYVECKALLGGVTTTQGIALFSAAGIRRYYRGIVRNVEETNDKLFPEAGSRIADVDAKDPQAFLKEIEQKHCFLLHLSEGTDNAAHQHFEALRLSGEQWAITPSLAGIHCAALQPADFGVLASRGASMVWSPFSNLLLYGQTADVADAPDYAEHTKFADHWLAAQPGSDGALAMAMGHVILKEFYVDRQVPYFEQYAQRFTDLPLLVTLRERGDAYVPDRFLRASDLGVEEENAEWKPVVLDRVTGEPVVPNGSVGHRYAPGDEGRWNLRLEGVVPALTLLDRAQERVAVDLPRFDVGEGEGGGIVRRGVPAIRVGDRLVTTVLDLTLAQYGVGRPGLPGDWPADYDDADQPCTPAWQEAISSVDRHDAARVAREFARNAEDTQGRSMIAMGAGTNHWYHSDQTYRTFLALLMLCGCEGVNGGGWAHYVGQEKVRPLTGWQTVAFALDWVRPPRHQSGTPFFYVATGQWRYERIQPEHLASPLGRGLLAGRHILDVNALGARLGWLPSYPSFDRSPHELVEAAEREGIEPAEYVVSELRAGRLRFACEDPDAPQNHPKVFTVWRSNILGSSGKGHEYFLKHLLGATDTAVRAEETPPELRPRDVTWREPAPEGKLDLMTTIDFRMTSNCLFSDVVLPAATWYEKYDLSTTDLHPFVNSFSPAVPPPWEAKSDWDAFHRIAQEFSRLAERHLGVRRDLVAAPLLHDSPDEIAQPLGEVRDWRAGECEPVPGKTMPKLIVVERDYPHVAEKWAALGPLLEQLGSQTKGASWKPVQEIDWLRSKNGTVRGGVADGRPSLERVEQACEAILALSGTTNGRLAVEGFRSMEQRTGVELADLAGPRAGDRVTFGDTQVQPRMVITSPEWSGIEAEGRRYAPFTTNVERQKPWHTLSGRQHFYRALRTVWWWMSSR